MPAIPQYRFQWDPFKARTNLDKHGVSFREAQEVFADPLALTLFDDEHSWAEERWITLGVTSDGQLLLLVVHTVQEFKNRMDIRIISARRANKNEIRCYQEGEI